MQNVEQELCLTIYSDDELLEVLKGVLNRLSISRHGSTSIDNVYYFASDAEKPLIDCAVSKAIDKGLLRLAIEVRCPRCAADLGRYRSVGDVPEVLVCDLCGRTWKKERDFDISYVIVVEPTEEGQKFFRGFRTYIGLGFRKIVRRIAKAKAKRVQGTKEP